MAKSKLVQTVTNFNKPFQNENESRGIRNVITQSIKEKWKQRGTHGQVTCLIQETWCRYQKRYRRHGSVCPESGN
jgi:hypothetical protein